MRKRIDQLTGSGAVRFTAVMDFAALGHLSYSGSTKRPALCASGRSAHGSSIAKTRSVNVVAGPPSTRALDATTMLMIVSLSKSVLIEDQGQCDLGVAVALYAGN